MLHSILSRRRVERAWALAQRPDAANSEQLYRRVIELSSPPQRRDARCIQAMIAVADLCMASGRHAEAWPIAEQLVNLYESDVGLDQLLLARALTRVANVRYLTEQKDAALADLRRAASLAESVLHESALEKSDVEKLLAAAAAPATRCLSEARERLARSSPLPFRDLLAAPTRYRFALGVIEAAETAAEALKSLAELSWKRKRLRPAAFAALVRLVKILDSPLQFDVSVLLGVVFNFAPKASTPKSRAAARSLALLGLALAEREWGSTSDRVLPALERVLELEHQLGDRAATARLVERSREIALAAWTNAEEREVRERLHGICTSLQTVAELGLASEIAQRGLLMALEERWPEEPSIIEWMQLAVSVLLAIRQAARAEALAADALAKCELLWGRDDPRLIRALHSLARVRIEQQDFAGAQELLERAVHLATKEWGEHDSRLRPSLKRLANLNYDLGQFGAAELLAARILSLAHAAPDLARMVRDFAFRGAVRFKLGRFRDAGEDWEMTLKFEQHLQPSDPAEMSTTMFNLAACCRISGDFSRAESLLHSALEVRRAQAKDDPSDLGATLRGLGELRVAENELVQAESFYAESLALWQDRPQASDPELALLLSRQGTLLSLLGRHIEAQETLGRAISMSEVTLGKNHPQVGECLLLAAEAHRRSGAAAAAEPLASRALAIYEEKLGSSAPRSIACRSLLNELCAGGADR